MLVYVVLQRDAAVAPNGTVHALLLPSADGEWEELSVGPSQFAGAGFGVFPRSTARLDWGALETPVLMPYLGLETVVQDAHLLKLLLRVLQGNFVPLTVSARFARRQHRAPALIASLGRTGSDAPLERARRDSARTRPPPRRHLARPTARPPIPASTGAPADASTAYRFAGGRGGGGGRGAARGGRPVRSAPRRLWWAAEGRAAAAPRPRHRAAAGGRTLRAR